MARPILWHGAAYLLFVLRPAPHSYGFYWPQQGGSVRDMLPGYDCPHEAIFLPATTHSFAGSITRQHAICVFEHDTARPLTRHMGYEEGEFGAVKGYVLVVRSISTVGK